MLFVYFYLMAAYWDLCLEEIAKKIKGVFKWHSTRQTK